MNEKDIELKFKRQDEILHAIEERLRVLEKKPEPKKRGKPRKIRIIQSTHEEGSKCGGCNWATIQRYRLSDCPEEDAQCPECFLEGLIAENKEVV